MNKEEFETELVEVYKENFDLWTKRLRRFVGEHLAEDAVQEGFLRAMLYREAFRKSRAAMAAWCWVIVLNAAKDIKEDERGGDSYRLQDVLGSGEEKLTLEEVLGKPDNRDAEEFHKIVLEEIADDRLSPRSQDILYLYYILGNNPRDITKILDANNKAVRNCVHQFKNYLVEKYGCFR